MTPAVCTGKQAERKVLTYQAYGDELMYAGIPVDRQYLTDKGGDFAALLFLLKEME